MLLGEYLGRAHIARYVRDQYTWNILIFPPPKWPLRRANTLATTIVQTPLLHSDNTIGTHFMILEMALGPLRPFAVPNKCMRNGAREAKSK